MNRIDLLLIATTIWAFATPVFAKSPELVPAPLEMCDGTNWSGLTMGKTTASDIKKQFKTGRSDLPMSQELPQPREAKQKVFALYSDKHDDSLLAAILLRYSDDGPNLTALSRAAGVPERDYYEAGRLEDWRLATFPSKGIVAFELTEFGRETVPMVILCPAGGVAAVCRGLRASLQPVVERHDPHANEPRIMRFGTATVRTDLKGLELKDGERQDVERTMIDTTAGGTMRYAVGAPGSYVTNVSGYFTPDKGGSLSVACTISGYGPYGLVTATGSSSKSLPAVKDAVTAYGGVNSNNYTIALYEALEKASSSFRDAMAASGPPPIQAVRAQQWQQLVENFRNQSQATASSSPEPVSPGTQSAASGAGGFLPRFYTTPEGHAQLKVMQAKSRDTFLESLDIWVGLQKSQKDRVRAIIGDSFAPVRNVAGDKQLLNIWQTLTPPQQGIIQRVGVRPPGQGDDYYRWLTNALVLTGDQPQLLRREEEDDTARTKARFKAMGQSNGGEGIDFVKLLESSRQEDDRINRVLTAAQRRKYDTLRPGRPDVVSLLASQAGT